MAPTAEGHAAAGSDRLRLATEEIESLLRASAAGVMGGAGGPSLARERAEQLVRVVVDLYGAGLESLLQVLYDAGRLDAVAQEALAGDELVAGLLLVHGLHPYDVTTRVRRALDEVRPYLATHGGDVELVDVTPEGTVRLRLLGSCDGCPSSSVTLASAVEGAVEAAAPEVTAIEVEQPGPAATPVAVSADTLWSRVHGPGRADEDPGRADEDPGPAGVVGGAGAGSGARAFPVCPVPSAKVAG